MAFIARQAAKFTPIHERIVFDHVEVSAHVRERAHIYRRSLEGQNYDKKNVVEYILNFKQFRFHLSGIRNRFSWLSWLDGRINSCVRVILLLHGAMTDIFSICFGRRSNRFHSWL